MKKVLVLLTALCLVGIVGALISGCGQQTPSINTVNSKPDGLSIRGTIYTTTLDGTRGDPISGAVVALSGDSSRYTAVTNSRGEYVISGIPDGYYFLVVTAEGHQRYSDMDVIIKPFDNVPADNTITVADIELSSRPIIINYSPVPNSVISQTPTFVVTFNEAMDTSTVIPAIVPGGMRTYALSGDTVQLLTSWSSDNKTLTITPEAALLANEIYGLEVDYGSPPTDAAGYPLDIAGEQAILPGQSYRVTTGGVPGALSNIVVTLGGNTFTSEAGGVDYADVMTGTNLRVYWDPPSTGGAVTGYKLYASVDGANYVFFEAYTTNYDTFTVGDLISALYDGTVDPVTTGNYPFINKAVSFKAVAFNGDGESDAASTAAIKELVGPQVDTGAFSGRTGGGGFGAEVLTNNYYLPALTDGTDTKIAYIAFNQPVDPATIIPANFTISAGTVTDATLLTSSSGNLTASFAGNVYSIVKITSDTDFAGGETFTAVADGVKDLAGNAVAAGGSTTNLLP